MPSAFPNVAMQRLQAIQQSRPGLFVKKLMDDQAPNLAALLAWGTLSALLPLILGMLSLIGLILRDPKRLDQVYATVLSVLPSDMTSLMSGVLNTMRQGSAASVGVIALLLLLVNGSNFFTNMASVFDRVYAVEPRNFVVERLIAVAMLIVTAALLVTSTAAAGIVSLVDTFPDFLPVGPAPGKIAGWSVSIVSIFAMFLVLYRVLPNKQLGWRQVVPGTFLSSVLLQVISEVFPVYVRLFPPNQAYALFGVFLVFTFWLYLLGFVLVLGAELNAFLLLASADGMPERDQRGYSQGREREHNPREVGLRL